MIGHEVEDGAFRSVLTQLTEAAPRMSLFKELGDGLLRTARSERVFVFRFRRSGGFKMLAARDFDGDDVANAQDCVSHYAVREMERSGSALIVSEARTDRRYRSEEVYQGRKPPRSIAIAPILAAGEIVGGVYFDHRFQVFEERLFETPQVRAWMDLCGVTVRLRELRSRCRLLETTLIRRERAETALPRAEADEAESVPTPSTRQRSPDRLRDFHGFLSANPDLLDMFDDIEKISTADLPILIRGETGSGKTLLARAVHRASSRADETLEVFSCGAIPDALVESELFGHVKGAFTGAETERVGLFVLANRGSLLLDEIGDLSPGVQTKLLRVLEDGLVRPLGSSEVATSVDVRLIATTRFDPDELVASGRLRGDLLYRLKAIELEVPPLRERWEDIAGLAAYFLERYNREGRSTTIQPSAMDYLNGYRWPGNVRELENEMRRLAALGVESIERDSLLAELAGGDREGGGTLDEVLAATERRVIEAALDRCRGNKSRAASSLGITRKALYRRLTKYGMGSGESRPSPTNEGSTEAR